MKLIKKNEATCFNCDTFVTTNLKFRVNMLFLDISKTITNISKILSQNYFLEDGLILKMHQDLNFYHIIV